MAIRKARVSYNWLNAFIMILTAKYFTSSNILGSMRHIALIAFALISLVMLAGMVECQDEVSWLTKAQQECANGSYALALKDMNLYLAQNPTDASALVSKGLIQMKLKKNEDALKSFDKVTELDSSNFDGWTNKALLQGTLGMSNESLESIGRALEIKPESANAWFNKGLLLENMGRMNESLEAYDNATKIDSSFVKAWMNEGMILKDQGNYEEALKRFDKVTELQSRNKDAWSAKGDILTALGRDADAKVAYKMAGKTGAK